ncbi:MAG: DUF3048 domain-containing protein [Clostridia bacterium]|nr:DUF3048 domain-containing protein [Clostridia bacterium]
MKRLISLLAVISLCVCLLASCGGKKDDGEYVPADTTVSQPEDQTGSDEADPEPPKDPDYTGVVNPITGLYNLTPDAAGKRFYTMMMGNSNEGIPQQGTSNADMIFEMLVEGGITRFMAFYADIDKVGDTVIGSCRSARTNFVSTAIGYDVIFGHYGGSESGYDMIKNNKVSDVDGLYYSQPYFWRDAARKKNLGMEHSAMTSGTQMRALAKKKKYRMDMKNPDYTVFTFNRDGDITANGTTSAATKVNVKFSGYMTSAFNYNEESGTYLKLRNGKAHIDGNNNKQLEFKNLIVISDFHSYEADKLHLVVEQKSGTGYYFCDGKAVKIKWSKGKLSNPFKFTKEDGSDLLVTPGKTYVAVIRTKAPSELTFS